MELLAQMVDRLGVMASGRQYETPPERTWRPSDAKKVTPREERPAPVPGATSGALADLMGKMNARKG